MVKDIRLSLGFFDHPKTVRLRRTLGNDGVIALLNLWMFAAQYKPDGILTSMDGDDIEIAARWNGMQTALLTALLKHGLLDANEASKTYTLHDWNDHQGFVVHSKERSEQAKRAAETRWNQHNHADSIADGMQTAMLVDARSNAPSPIPTPTPNPSPKKRSNKKRNPPPDELWIEDLKTSPAYAGIDIETELAKCLAWFKSMNPPLVVSRKRFLNWLNKADRPLRAPTKTTTSKTEAKPPIIMPFERHTRTCEGPVSVGEVIDKLRKVGVTIPNPEEHSDQG